MLDSSAFDIYQSFPVFFEEAGNACLSYLQTRYQFLFEHTNTALHPAGLIQVGITGAFQILPAFLEVICKSCSLSLSLSLCSAEVFRIYIGVLETTLTGFPRSGAALSSEFCITSRTAFGSGLPLKCSIAASAAANIGPSPVGAKIQSAAEDALMRTV